MPHEDDADLAEVFRTEAAAILEGLGGALLRLEKEGAGGAAHSEAYRLFHTLKGMANMAGFEDAARACHEAESALAPGQSPPVDALLARLDEAARHLGQAAPAAAATAATAAASDETRGQVAEARADAAFVPVDVRRLDALLNLVGELSVVATSLQYERRMRDGERSDGTIDRLTLLVRSLQDEVTRARLIPVRTLFSRLPRLVRDAAKAHGREVQLDLEDHHLELDRAIVDRMTGVLAHLTQNALVHGIEPPDARRKAGKPPAGRLKVRARREHETVVVEVEDDGRGLDLDRVRARAVERGILTSDEADALSDDAALELLFAPGFSTSETTSRHAGRGVGLTAAREVARELGGSLSVSSRPGAGTRVTVRLPPSVALLDTLLARVGDATVALPLRNVRRIVPASEASRVAGAPTLIHEGRPLPVHGVPGLAPAADGAGFVVVADAAHGTFGLAVDRVVGTHSAVLKPLDASFTRGGGALGATVLGSGVLAVVLNMDAYKGVESR